MANSITSRDLSITSTSFGGIFVYDGSTGQVIATGVTPTLLTAFNTAAGSDGLFYDCTPVKASSKITVTRAGVYKIAYSFSYAMSVNFVVWEMYAFVNGVQVNGTGAMSKTDTAADTQCISGVGFATVAANQDVDLRGYHDQGGNVTITPSHVNFVVMRVGN